MRVLLEMTDEGLLPAEGVVRADVAQATTGTC